MARRDKQAEELVRSLQFARRLHGVLFADADGRWVISHPSFPAENLEALAAAVWAPDVNRHELSRLLGARETLELSAGTLGKAAYHLNRLGDGQAVADLASQGVGPLKGYQGRDLDALLAMYRAAFDAASAFEGPCFAEADLRARLTFLFGAPFADYALEVVSAFESPPVETRRTSEFIELVERFLRNEGPQSPTLRPAFDRLAKLPADRRSRARAFVALFREFIADNHLSVRRREMEGVALSLIDDLDVAAKRLDELVSDGLEKAPERPAFSRRGRVMLLALLMTHPDERLELPPTLPVASLEVLFQTARVLPGPDAKLIIHAFIASSYPLRHPAYGAFRRGFSGATYARGIRLNAIRQLGDFESEARANAWLDAVEHFGAEEGGLDPFADWFIRAFDGPRWQATSTLLVMPRFDDDPESLVASLLGLSAIGNEPSMSHALDRWLSPPQTRLPVIASTLGDLLGVDEEQVNDYLYHRQVAGHGQTFSRAIRAPVDLAEREAAELRHLSSLPEPSTTQRKRIASLSSNEARSERERSAIARARNAFERGLEVARGESLRAILHTITAASVERILGRPLDAENLPPDFDAFILLTGASKLDLNLARAFISDVLAGTPLRERAENHRWLSQAREAGLDVDSWLLGFDRTVETDAGPLRFRTEDRPLHVLKMGSYFDTCLSLTDGFNAASTLVNALDANKHIVYGYNSRGHVVARKLIAISRDGRLIGYHTYSAEGDALRLQLEETVTTWARGFGLAPANAGEPEKIHDAFWYDDGTTPWFGGLNRSNLDAPNDSVGFHEALYSAGFDAPEHWVHCAGSGWDTWCSASYVRLWQHFPARAKTELNYWTTPFSVLAARGNFAWIGAHPDGSLAHEIEIAFQDCPADVDAIHALATHLRKTKLSGGAETYAHLFPPSPALAAGDPSDVVKLFEIAIRSLRKERCECLTEDGHDHCIEAYVRSAADVLQVAIENRAEGPSQLPRLLKSREPLLNAIAVEVLTRIQDRASATLLRARFRRDGPDGVLEVAIRNQGGQADHWMLEENEAREFTPVDLEKVTTSTRDVGRRRWVHRVALASDSLSLQAFEKLLELGDPNAGLAAFRPAGRDERLAQHPKWDSWEHERSARLMGEVLDLDLGQHTGRLERRFGDHVTEWHSHIARLGDAERVLDALAAASSELSASEFDELVLEFRGIAVSDRDALKMHFRWLDSPYRLQRHLLRELALRDETQTLESLIGSVKDRARATWLRSTLE